MEVLLMEMEARTGGNRKVFTAASKRNTHEKANLDLVRVRTGTDRIGIIYNHL